MKGHILNKQGQDVPVEAAFGDKGRVFGIYFSAGWCPPCKQFTPVLAKTSELLRQGGPALAGRRLPGHNHVHSGGATAEVEAADPRKFEILFVSADKDQAGFDAYYGAMPAHWLAVRFSSAQVRQELGTLFGVSGIPNLVLINGEDGSILNRDGRAAVAADPSAEKFPWRPRSGPAELSELERRLLQYGCELTALAAVKENAAGRLSGAELHSLEEQILASQNLMDGLPSVSSSVLEGASEDGGDASCSCCAPAQMLAGPGLPPPVFVTLDAPFVPLRNVELLLGEGMERYAGATLEASTLPLANMLDIPQTVRSSDPLKRLTRLWFVSSRLLLFVDVPGCTGGFIYGGDGSLGAAKCRSRAADDSLLRLLHLSPRSTAAAMPALDW